MTKRQLMAMYYESHIVEAREQLRLVLAMVFGNPKVDSADYVESLRLQADPPDKEEATELGASGFEKARKLFGAEIRGV